MTGTTNRIGFEEAADLLESGRACVSFVVDGRPRVEPAVVRYEGGRFLVGIDGAPPGPDATEVTLVVDEGVHFFDLRAMHVRGTPARLDPPLDGARTWLAVTPTRVTCWDYGRLRIADEPG